MVNREAMNMSALKIGLLAMAAAAVSTAQNAATDGVQYISTAEAHDLGHLVSYKVPVAKPSDEYYKVPAVPSGVRSMPAYHVTDIRVTIFRDRDIYTRAGMIAVSFRRHPGLLVGNQFKSNEPAAYETFLRDDWNNTKSDYWDMAHAMAQGGDPGEGHMIVEAINDEDLRMRAEAEETASAPAIGRFQIASAETGTKLLELPEETIDIPLVKKTW